MLSDSASGWFGFGPISVVPEFQGPGIGSELMQSSIATLEAMGASGCAVLGDPAEYFQALSFSDEFPKGDKVAMITSAAFSVSYKTAIALRTERSAEKSVRKAVPLPSQSPDRAYRQWQRRRRSRTDPER